MGRVNYINLVEQIYRANPNIEDEALGLNLWHIAGYEPSLGTIQVWKTRLRKRGIDIPDRRKKK
jgi:hypothetical protein